MSDIYITQAEADALIAMEKHVFEQLDHHYPEGGQSIEIPLASAGKREFFSLDIYQGRIDLSQATFQNRGRQAIILVRLDINGPPHRNPDGEELPCPHLHLFREGYGDKWALPIPSDSFPDVSGPESAFDSFMKYCNISQPPRIQWRLVR